ncbi:hypothetical protein PanWU01x14_055960 [Parasponia andersonii]|uniref:Uncharacterized protein n=1 Tax=Parasponia andersonii TaxID=3476 RepID=A0A2P5DKA2_PARAD|nr:hypothetical protein PanWU01x14_055960 [Parasponia andersonii]
MVVPYGANCPAAEIRHDLIVGLIHGQCRPYESKIPIPKAIPELELVHGATPEQISNRTSPIHTLLHVHRVVEVVEPNNGADSNIRRSQRERTYRKRPVDLRHEGSYREVERRRGCPDEDGASRGSKGDDIGGCFNVSP